jgi:succinate dehydrogenase / fumarate reductase, flavoprotein subunit
MSESLRNDGRIWVPVNRDDNRPAAQIPESERDYFLERKYPAFGNLVPRDVASRNAKTVVDEGRGVGPLKNGVNLDFSEAIGRLGEAVVRERYGNLFDMYERITGENPYQMPMRIYPATHYTMGGLWVDYNLMTNVPGLYALGEANFSDHGANRLGASALMQGLADGYFVAPYTIGDYLSGLLGQKAVPADDPVFRAAEGAIGDDISRWLSVNGTKSVDYYHRELGKIVWDNIGMARDKVGLEKAIGEIPALREEFRKNVRVLGGADGINQSLEKVGRVDDFFELAELMARDALHREESCGGHFRVEHQTEEGEAKRDDDNFAYVGAWEWAGPGKPQNLHKEPLEFEYVHLTQRSYK